MFLPRKSLLISLLTFVFVTIVLTTVGTTLLIEKEKVFGNINVNGLALIFRTSFSLIGGLISGIIAFTIFDLNYRKDLEESYKLSKRGFSFVLEEIKENKQAATELLSILNQGSLETINDMLKSEGIREHFIIAKTKFSTELIDKTLTNLNEEHYFKILNDISTLKKIINTLDLISSEVKDSDNNLALLRRLKALLTIFADSPTPSETCFSKSASIFLQDSDLNFYLKKFWVFIAILSITYLFVVYFTEFYI
ncbi:hypothetical protein H1Q58_09000 [Planococcus maritimus]|uniref:Uncharacterized protein n=1 Tax=Planococcus maritimus TaxID=192421 RepID=A0A7D7RK33_PLAMR|nr:hypothetical protein [Planococcus maritimus]QMT16124.1 hypothetical protein H1Q58_09000 [Planococcus maritimus]